MQLLGEFFPIQIQTTQGAAMPQFDDQPVEQRLAGEAGCVIVQAGVENFRENGCRIHIGEALCRLRRPGSSGRLVERQNHFTRQHTRGIRLLVHGPNHIAGLRDRGLEFSAAVMGRFKNCGKVTAVPVLKDDGKPAVWFQKAERGFDAARQALLVMLLGVAAFAADNGLLLAGFLRDRKTKPVIPQNGKIQIA